MRIAVYSSWLKIKGGAEKVVLDIISSLEQEHQVDVYTGFYSPDETYPEFKKYRINVIKPSLNPKNFMTIGVSSIMHYFFSKNYFKSYDVTIVSSGGIAELILIKNKTMKNMIYCHTPLRPAHQFYHKYLIKLNAVKKIIFKISIWGYKLLEKMAWKRIDVVVCNSQNIKNVILKDNLVPENKTINVIYPAVNLKNFSPHKKYNNYFLTSGRFKPYKRFELVISAFEIFQKFNPKFRLKIIGSLDDLNYFNYIKKMTMNNKNIDILTNLKNDEWVRQYQNCFAYLFTAENEDFGIVPLEAMSCGKPVIAVNEGGVVESVLNKKTGFLVKPNPVDVSDKMVYLFKNIKKYNSMVKSSIARVNIFSFDTFKTKINNLINEISHS